MFVDTAIADRETSVINEIETGGGGGGTSIDVVEEEREENGSACVKTRAARIESKWAETLECGDEDGFCTVEGSRRTAVGEEEVGTLAEVVVVSESLMAR
jgi:hypothetical protein